MVSDTVATLQTADEPKTRAGREWWEFECPSFIPYFRPYVGLFLCRYYYYLDRGKTHMGNIEAPESLTDQVTHDKPICTVTGEGSMGFNSPDFRRQSPESCLVVFFVQGQNSSCSVLPCVIHIVSINFWWLRKVFTVLLSQARIDQHMIGRSAIAKRLFPSEFATHTHTHTQNKRGEALLLFPPRLRLSATIFRQCRQSMLN